jgi:hypothetical protein
MAGRLLRGQVGDGQGVGMVRWVLDPLNRAQSTCFVGYRRPAVTGGRWPKAGLAGPARPSEMASPTPSRRPPSTGVTTSSTAMGVRHCR